MFTYMEASVNVRIVEPELVADEFEGELRVSGFHCSEVGTITLVDFEQFVPICLLFMVSLLNSCIIVLFQRREHFFCRVQSMIIPYSRRKPRWKGL